MFCVDYTKEMLLQVEDLEKIRGQSNLLQNTSQTEDTSHFVFFFFFFCDIIRTWLVKRYVYHAVKQTPIVSFERKHFIR